MNSDDDISDLPAFFGHTIFCDDIRQEIGGKTTYVGAYHGVIFVRGTFPVTLPKFAFAITLYQKREFFISDFAFKIFLPGDAPDSPSIYGENKESEPGSTLANAFDSDPAVPDEQKRLIRTEANIFASPIKFNVPGPIKVRASLGDKIVKLGRLTVRAQNVSATSPESTPTS